MALLAVLVAGAQGQVPHRRPTVRQKRATQESKEMHHCHALILILMLLLLGDHIIGHWRELKGKR